MIKSYSTVASSDGFATKIISRSHDGFNVLTTFVDLPGKSIVCISTQVGCPVGCTFCAAGVSGRFVRNLNLDELEEQVRIAASYCLPGKPVLVSLMGEGEPLDNVSNCLDLLFKASSLLPSYEVRTALSTSLSSSRACGLLVTRIAAADFDLPFKLQVSLHGATDRVRRRFIPKSPALTVVMSAVDLYVKTSLRPVEFNYVLVAGENDSPEDAENLAFLMRHRAGLVKLNRFNSWPGVSFTGSDAKVKETFAAIRSRGLEVEEYETNGSDILAACGQLTYTGERP